MTAAISGTPTFGAGRFFGIGAYANPTPARAHVPQSQSIDWKRKTEPLFGEKQLPVALAAGEMEISGKVEFGKVQPRFFSDMLLGVGSTTGSYKEADNEVAAVPGTGPYTVTVANATNFLLDLGVRNADTGALMTCVASGSEVAGVSYSVGSGANKGKYTFASGDQSANVKISYGYTVSLTGETISMTNVDQGPSSAFKAVHVFPWGSEQNMIVFNNAIAGSGGISAKKSGFGSFTLDFMAAADNDGVVGTMTFAEAA